MRIAVVEDEMALNQFLCGLLENSGHRVKGFFDGESIIKELKRETYDAILLDWEMPTRSGLDVLDWMNSNLSSMPPVIMVTSRMAETDVVKALGAGADDYVCKPVQPAVMLARLEAVTRRTYNQTAQQACEVFGPYRFDSGGTMVELNGEAIELTTKELNLARLMLRNANRPLSRSYLLETVWGHGAELNTRTLDVHISQIRIKLRLRPENGLTLSSIYGFGYRLEWLSGEQ
jgi:DNA-binding response OmpR family regulator